MTFDYIAQMKYLRWLVGVILLTGMGLMFWDWRQSGLDFLPWLDDLPWLYTIIALLLLFVAKTVVWLIPLRVLYLTAGFLMSAPHAFLVIYLGLFFELSIGYLIGRHSRVQQIHSRMNRYRVSRWIFRSVRQNPLPSCFVARFLPTPPADVTNIFLGSLGMRYSEYIIASLLGLTPAMVPLVFIGESALDPLSADFIIPFAVSLLLAGLSLFISLKIRNRNGNGRKDPEGQTAKTKILDRFCRARN